MAQEGVSEFSFSEQNICAFTMIQGTVLYFETGARMIHGDTFCVGNRPRLESLGTLCGPGCASPKFGLAAAVTLGRLATGGLIPGPHQGAS